MALAQMKKEAGAKTAREIVNESFGRFETAINDAAREEVRDISRDRELTNRLTESFDAYLRGREPTLDILDTFMRTDGNNLVYNYAEEAGMPLFYTFGVFSYRYRGGKLSIEEAGMEGLDSFLSDLKEKAADIVSAGMGTGGRTASYSLTGEDMYTVTLERISSLFNSSVGYEGNPSAPVQLEAVQRGKLPLVMTPEGTLNWSSGVTSVAELTF